MEKFAQAIQQPEYVHVLLNHLPITGLFVALLLLLTALAANHRFTLCASLALVAGLSLSAWPVAHYGERAFDRALALSDDAGGQYLKRHAELADHWIFLYYLTSAAAVAALVVAWKKPKFLRPAAGVVALLVLASLIAGAVIADAGGKIRHGEFRYGPPPTERKSGDQS